MGGVGFCSMGGVGFCSMYGPGFFSNGSNGLVGPSSVGGLGLDSMICEKRIRDEGRDAGEGPAGRDDPIRRPARMAPAADAINVHMAYLAETCYEPFFTLPTQGYQNFHRWSTFPYRDGLYWPE